MRNHSGTWLVTKKGIAEKEGFIMVTEHMERGAEAGFYATVLRRVSWGAIFAGTIVALAIQLALNVLGLGIGLGIISPTEGVSEGIGFGAGIWFLLSTLIALYFGGWVAGRMAGFPRKLTGTLHGLVVWALATLFSFYLMNTAIGTVLGGISGAIGRGLTALSQTTEISPERARETAKEALEGEQAAPETPGPQAGVDKERALQITEQIADALSRAAIWAFVAMVLGAIAAALGGRTGTPREGVLMPPGQTGA